MRPGIIRASVALGLAVALVASFTASGAGSARAATNSTLTFASLAGTTANFDPAQGSINEVYFLAPVYDTLIRESTTATFSPDLATSWEYVNPVTFTMTLRTGINFVDGTPFNAAAVKANLMHVKTGTGPLATELADLGSITVVNSNTVTLHLTKPYPSLPTVLASVSGMMASPKVLGSSTLATTPDGTGPYTLDMAATIANDTYTYQKRSDYWNSAAYPYQTIVVKEMTPSAQVNALEAGQLTAAEFGDATSISRIEHAGISFTGGPYNVWTLFLLDRAGTLVPALKSVLVRQALNYAINRPALVKAVQLGLGKPTTQLLKPGDEGYSAALNNEYPYNPTKAKQLLAQAGYAKGFTMSTVSISTFDTATQALAGYYSAIGVTLKIVDVPPAEYISSIVGGKYPTALLPYGVIDSYYDFGQFATPNAGFNPFHTSDPVVNKLYSEAASAPAAQRPTLLEQLNARLVSHTFGIAYTKAVKGILWKDLRPPLYYNWAPTS